MYFLVIITVGRCSMQFFPSLLFKNDRISRNDGSYIFKFFPGKASIFL